MKISPGFSTCPDNTFIFDAMIRQKVDTEGLALDVVLADVEEINQFLVNLGKTGTNAVRTL